MATKAEGTAQPHVIRLRPHIRKILPDPSMGPEKLPPIDRNGGFDFSGLKLPNKEQREAFKRRGRAPYGWSFTLVRGGMVGTLFDRYISNGDIRRAMRQAKTKTISEKSPKNESFLGSVGLLTNTSKMGCFSWNLPAGPEAHGGTCPGAQLAFYLDPDGEDKSKAIAIAIARSKSHAAEQMRAEVPNAREAVDRFICNGCYAMKNCYGNPSMVAIMEWRRAWLTGWAMPKGLFIPTMVGAIKISQKISRARVQAAGTDPFAIAECTYPDYFRIHDAGDMVNEEYFDSWLEICRKLPGIKFWAPTRIWAHGQMALVLEDRIRRGKIPKNLALRPSGLFFDAPGPIIPGVAGGASSNVVSFRVSSGKIKTSIKGATGDSWVCPAYLPTTVGGGALPKIMTIQSGASLLTEARQRRLLASMAKFVTIPAQGTYLQRIKKAAKDLEKKTEIPQVLKRTQDLVAEQLKAERKPNPRQQAFAMYPRFDAATPAGKQDVFFDAVYNPSTKAFVVNPTNGKPLRATETNLKKHPGTIAAKVQEFQAAGACTVARDPNHASACRVCWGATDDKPDKEMKSLPIVYGKH